MRFTIKHYSFHKVGRITVPPERIDRVAGVIFITPEQLNYLAGVFGTDPEDILGWSTATPHGRVAAETRREKFHLDLSG